MACIYSAKYLLTDDARPIVGGALLAVAGKIAAVGPLAELTRAHPGVEVVEFADAVLAPLLINAHTHLELTDFPAWAQAAGEGAEPVSFVDWILRLIRVKRTLGPKQFNRSVANGIELSIASGTGAVGDIMAQHASRKAYCGTSLPGVLFLESLGQDPTIITKIKQELRSVLAEGQVGQMRLGLTPHSPYSISASYLRDIYAKCQREDLPCTTHLAESPAEVEFIAGSSGELATQFYPRVGWQYLIPAAAGCRPAQYLQQQGGLFPGNLLVHGVQLNQAEIELLAARQMALVLCPRSNARLDVGQAPVAKLLAAGVSLAIGTDSLASNDSLSVWDELTFAHQWFQGQLDAPTLFRMATHGGAAALGLEQRLGSLAVGKDASFQVLQPKGPLAASELSDYLVAPGRNQEILQVYHQGSARLSGLP